ncbi:hypothetical protein [Crocosphaera sp. XPORK-15E]|uniref:hypothetical protein n=1 Tax=Crocosphaera sp. XPORK-15E TaxID=3110247 RepID=UPI002B1ECBC1|nr:hypothetical protein [Crocosphaera sp. XPORK-15E]MEA5535623.1 hypothetical protein [Crocosphaera sp. XPORK-15E]
MNLPFFPKYNQEQINKINQNLEQQHEDLTKKFDLLKLEARGRYNRSNLWGILHLFFSLLASGSSLASLILTFNNNTKIIAITSSISAISAAIIPVFNFSRRETKLLALKELCQSTEIECISLDYKFKNSTNIDEKIKLLETINERLQQINKKLNEPY